MGHLKRLVQCGLDLYFFLLADSVRPAHDSETKVISTVDQIYNSQLDLIYHDPEQTSMHFSPSSWFLFRPTIGHTVCSVSTDGDVPSRAWYHKHCCMNKY